MDIRKAVPADTESIAGHDCHIKSSELETKIKMGYVYTAYDNGNFTGWLRYGLFWDSIPFMNMLYVLEPYRMKGIGKQLVKFWENEMRAFGYKMVMTSSLQTEYAQHFYTKSGYASVGGFVLPGEPLEIMFIKFI